MPSGKVDWNAGEYDTGGTFETLPKGRYLAVVVDSEEKKTKDRTGSYFEFEFDVLAPKQYRKRKLWARLNVKNPSEVAQRIGREQFNAMIEAAGKEKSKVTDTTQLHNLAMVVIVDIEHNMQNGRETNRVTGFMKASDEARKATEGYRPEPNKRKETAQASNHDREQREQQRREPVSSTVPEDDDIPF